MNEWSAMYENGYQNAMQFAYIPDFKNTQEKADWERGYKDGKNWRNPK